MNDKPKPPINYMSNMKSGAKRESTAARRQWMQTNRPKKFAAKQERRRTFRRFVSGLK